MNKTSEIGKKQRARGGWDEDDTTKITKPVTNPNPTIQVKTMDEFRRPIEKQLIVQSPSIEYESKILEDMLVPSGISIKPSDTQLADFLKRIKTLNKDTISRLILEKIKANENSIDTNSNKVLMKAIYIVEHILIKKIEGYQPIFEKNKEIFNSVLNNSMNNKKQSDLVNNVLNLINGEKPKNQSHNSMYNSAKTETKKTEDLLEQIQSSSKVEAIKDEDPFNGLNVRTNETPQNTENKVSNYAFLNKNKKKEVVAEVKPSEPIKENKAFTFIGKNKNNSTNNIQKEEKVVSTLPAEGSKNGNPENEVKPLDLDKLYSDSYPQNNGFQNPNVHPNLQGYPQVYNQNYPIIYPYQQPQFNPYPNQVNYVSQGPNPMNFVQGQYNFNPNQIPYTPNQVPYNQNSFMGGFYPNNIQTSQTNIENKKQFVDPDEVKKVEKDHFDFVNNLFKKK